MKDVTSTSFGLIIAFLLPGLASFFSLAYWVPDIRTICDTLRDAKSDVGLFLFVVLVSLTIGLQISAVRYLLFECVLCFRWRLKPDGFKNLGDKDKAESFRMAIDEAYRYHQFSGGMFIVQPFLFWGCWHTFDWPKDHLYKFLACVVTIELITIVAAISALHRYTKRAKAILGE